MTTLTLLVTIISATAAAVGAYLTYQRFRREVPRKALAYYATPLNPARTTFRIHMSNAGNRAIEQQDWITPECGFDFGKDASIRQVSVEDQIPPDLGLPEQEILISNSRKVEIPLSKLWLNPRDGFTMLVLLEQGIEGNPTPYGRIREVHNLFKEVGAPTARDSAHPSVQTYLAAAASVITALIAAASAILTAYLAD